MFGLPKSTELNKFVAKKVIYSKFNMNNAERDKFDADIKHIAVINEVSTRTTNIEAGKKVKAFYILLINLKRQNFAAATITKISRLIDQNMLLMLEYEGQYKLAVYYDRLLQSQWQYADDIALPLQGMNMDAVWEAVVKYVGSVQIAGERTLTQQLAVDEQNAKIQRQIERLTKQKWNEKQPQKKFAIMQQMKQLKEQLQ